MQGSEMGNTPAGVLDAVGVPGGYWGLVVLVGVRMGVEGTRYW